jgi:hypothetical protein
MPFITAGMYRQLAAQATDPAEKARYLQAADAVDRALAIKKPRRFLCCC